MVCKSLALIASAALFITSCNNDKTEEPAVETKVENYSVQAPLPDSAGVEKTPATVNQVQVDASASAPKGNSVGSPALNPAHGQPGHRCDLAVGAPLPATENKNVNAVPSVKLENSKPALNPAHGQPGHRCDLAVGAPLDTPMPTTNK